MKIVSALLLVFALAFASAVSAQTQAGGQATQPAAAPLTNDSVIKLLKAGAKPEDVVAKIKDSRCNFDTSPEVVRALHKSKVPEVVITAMLEATARATASSPSHDEATADIRAEDIRDAGKIKNEGGSFPECVYCPRPDYSPEARAKKMQGVVVLRVVVTSEGRATNISVERQFGYGLDEKAIESAKKWKFKPAKTKEGVAVPVSVLVEVNFRLN